MQRSGVLLYFIENTVKVLLILNAGMGDEEGVMVRRFFLSVTRLPRHRHHKRRRNCPSSMSETTTGHSYPGIPKHNSVFARKNEFARRYSSSLHTSTIVFLRMFYVDFL